jgi:hypothetical protein
MPVENKSFKPKPIVEPCFFCHNAFNAKKHRFVFKHRRVAYVCLRCLEGFGGKAKVQQILEQIPFPREELNYKKEAVQ